MKKNRAEPSKKNIKFIPKRQPDIRDDLDNRRNEEQDFKGDDITHNVKHRRNQPGRHK